jgi:hypothetical protein
MTHTVISNTSEGAWPIAALLDERLPVADRTDQVRR